MRLKIEFQENNISTYPKISADCRQNFGVTTDVPWHYVTKDVPSVYLFWDIPRSSIMGYPKFAIKEFYVINDVPIKWCGDVTTDETIFENSDVITYVPLKANVGM